MAYLSWIAWEAVAFYPGRWTIYFQDRVKDLADMSDSGAKDSNDTGTTKRHIAGNRASRTSKTFRKPKPTGAKQSVFIPVDATTFGIEFEFLLAFKQDLLQSTLNRHNLEADIVKQFTSNEHRSLLGEFASHHAENPSHNCRERYPSWVLHVAQNDIVCTKGLHHGNFTTKVSHDKQWIRRYVMESLLMVSDRLQEAGLPANVIGLVEPDPANLNDPHKAEIPFPGKDGNVMIRKSLVDYTKWTLTNDHTLMGALRSQLQEHLEKQGIAKDEVADWDSQGMELISPVFDLDTKPEAFQQIGRYLHSLAGKDTSILESVWASTHVHIGLKFDKREDMPILLLQHLAYILVLHEDLLSKCHPRSRCGIEVTKSTPPEPVWEEDEDEEFDPDAPFPEPAPSPSEEEKERENEAQVLAFEAEYTGVGTVDSNARYLRGQLAGRSPRHQLYEIRDKIFQKYGTIFDLVELLQRPKDASDIHGPRHRGYMYNFANLWALAKGETAWKPIKPTIEFRQHACTLDAEAVRHWVTLLEGIVRTAARKAAETSQFGSSIALDATRTFAEQEASKYPTMNTTALPWPHESMSSFCVRFLGLDEEEGHYWEARFAQFKDDRPGEA